MKKKYLNIALALVVAFAGFIGFHIDSNAETEKIEWAVTYNGSGFDSTYSADKAKIADVMPGDTVEFAIDYNNGTSSYANFYMSADVLKTLEDTEGTEAEGSAYSRRGGTDSEC